MSRQPTQPHTPHVNVNYTHRCSCRHVAVLSSLLASCVAVLSLLSRGMCACKGGQATPLLLLVGGGGHVAHTGANNDWGGRERGRADMEKIEGHTRHVGPHFPAFACPIWSYNGAGMGHRGSSSTRRAHGPHIFLHSCPYSCVHEIGLGWGKERRAYLPFSCSCCGVVAGSALSGSALSVLLNCWGLFAPPTCILILILVSLMLGVTCDIRGGRSWASYLL